MVVREFSTASVFGSLIHDGQQWARHINRRGPGGGVFHVGHYLAIFGVRGLSTPSSFATAMLSAVRRTRENEWYFLIINVGMQCKEPRAPRYKNSSH